MERDGGSRTEGGWRGGERECLFIWRQAGPHRGGHRRAGCARSAHEKVCMGICVEGVRGRGDGAMRRRGDGEWRGERERWRCRRGEVSGESVKPAGDGESVEGGQATTSSATDWDRSVPHNSGKQSSKFSYTTPSGSKASTRSNDGKRSSKILIHVGRSRRVLI